MTMKKQFTTKTIDRNTGREIKKALREERKAKARANEIKHRANESEWQAELRRLGF
jgi:hypothetical protein